MILVDAVYINDGGGKVLLDYLIDELEKTGKQIFYLLDKRVAGENFNIKASNTLQFMESNFSLRKKFYSSNKSSFTSILCFGNIPPNVKTTAVVYTYFHQLLFLKIPADLPLHKKVLYWIKTNIVRGLKSNTNFWVVQSDLVATLLSQKYKVSTKSVKVLPVYKELPVSASSIRREPKSFLYVSNATPHKNHLSLINAFCRFFDETKAGKLTLTVSDHYPAILNMINSKIKEGYPIINNGFISQSELSALYASHEYLIFPSSTESFGLPIVEAIEKGCKVVAPDLPYVHAICMPSFTFKDNSESSIFAALKAVYEQALPTSFSKVSNKMSELLEVLR